MRIKVCCNYKHESDLAVNLAFRLVVDSSEENAKFFGANISLFCTADKAASDKFVMGKMYYIDFSQAEEQKFCAFGSSLPGETK